MPEIRVGAALYELGFRYRRHVTSLPGTPDFANRRRRWAIFVHGCFWHSHHGCRRATVPKTRTEYWLPKLMGNVERDKAHIEELQRLGFLVLVIWECQIRDADSIRDVLARELAPKSE